MSIHPPDSFIKNTMFGCFPFARWGDLGEDGRDPVHPLATLPRLDHHPGRFRGMDQCLARGCEGGPWSSWQSQWRVALQVSISGCGGGIFIWLDARGHECSQGHGILSKCHSCQHHNKAFGEQPWCHKYSQYCGWLFEHSYHWPFECGCPDRSHSDWWA